MGQTDNSLKIYSASAGSGKTYTLTGEYLRLLFQGMLNGEGVKYDRILVATFTNKATVELRERILGLLYDLSKGTSDRAEELIKKLTFAPGLSDADKQLKIQAQAREALKRILEDYGKFRVQTIDSFFQEVVRSFMLELSSTHGGFEVEIDQNAVFQLSMDRLIDELQNSTSKHTEMLSVLRQIFDEGAEDGERVDLRAQLTGLLSPLIDGKEQYDLKELEEQFSTDQVTKTRLQLQEIAQKLERKLEKAKKDLEEIRNKYHLNFADSSRSFVEGIYNKLNKGEAITAIAEDKLLTSTTRTILAKVKAGDKRAWCPKGKSEQVYGPYEAASDELLGTLSSLDLSEEELYSYNTATLMLKYLIWMPAILNFKKSLDEFQAENNIVLISEINPLLKSIIAGASIPFIYEKVGSYIEHYMLDEFQDTSHDQWSNFEPLLEESHSYSRINYLVGDVKQSIYRFRGADSTLLGHEVPTKYGVRPDILDTNYRSAYQIVEFNNKFFSNIYDLDFFEHDKAGAPTLYDAENVEQKKHNTSKEDGYVRITATKERMSPEELQSLLQELYDDGYKPGDIVLLFRKRKESVEVADWLRSFGDSDKTDNSGRYSYDFVSDEALAINSSPVVRCLASLVHRLAHPDDPNAQGLLDISLQTLPGLDPMRYEDLLHQLDNLSNTGLSIYETVTEAMTILKDNGAIKDEDKAYVAAYLEQLFNYTARFTPTYLQFDNWWQGKRDDLYIDMPDTTMDCLRLMTIHNAKGLEFPVVIIPFASWEMTPSGRSQRMLLMKTPEQLPEDFPKVPSVYYMKEAPGANKEVKSYFAPQYRVEQERLDIDNINLLYVAFTRPTQRLYVFTQKKPDTTTERSIATLISSAKSRLGKYECINETTDRYTYGEPKPVQASTASADNRMIEITALSATPQYAGLSFAPKPFESTATRAGEKMHFLMEFVRTTEDFYRLIDPNSQDTDLTTLIDAFRASESRPEVQEWFAPKEGWQVFTETQFYSPRSDRTIRADRILLNDTEHQAIVLDYKFGEPHASHKRQVREYISVLNEMGYNTRGYLWYRFGEIIQVEP